ncbi:hypothetical protein HanRHA438_Chr15g0724551 [Helianthus annuus]|nr:hypothetical protein HanRHA438_Chr15g0724551 [Helianthus annuus]
MKQKHQNRTETKPKNPSKRTKRHWPQKVAGDQVGTDQVHGSLELTENPISFQESNLLEWI